MHKRQAVQYVLISQLTFFLTLLVCIAIEPSVLLQNNPISMFGNLPKTIVPFMVGFIVQSIILFRASLVLPKNSNVNRKLARMFKILAVVVLGLSVTPFTINTWFYIAHVFFAACLYVTELNAGIWLLRHTRFNIVNYLLYGLLVSGLIIAILSTGEVGVLNLLAVGQLLVIASFSILLVKTVREIERDDVSIQPTTT